MLKAVIEMPMGSIYKYEDKEGTLVLDRINPIRVPYNYGYIKGTSAKDGDALDVFVVSEDDIQPLATVEIELIGGYHCLDNGVEDDKIIAKVKGDTRQYPLEIINIYLDNYKPGFKRLYSYSELEAADVIERSLQ